MEKSKNLHDQLKELKSEIEVLKVEDKQSLLDVLHEQNVNRGENKYSTLGKVWSSDQLLDRWKLWSVVQSTEKYYVMIERLSTGKLWSQSELLDVFNWILHLKSFLFSFLLHLALG